MLFLITIKVDSTDSLPLEKTLTLHNIIFFDSIIKVRLMRQKQPKKHFMVQKKSVKIWDFNVDNIVISKLAQTKTSSKCLIGYLDEVVRTISSVIA